ncbi:hypothetical protein F01_30047 [Burkholderia cenocepacia]|nr:hypothetical protein F01_30047 [Burkholderia cenocepacia]
MRVSARRLFQTFFTKALAWMGTGA